MKRYFIKKRGKNNDFLELEIEGHLLRQTFGKVGSRAVKKTTHCGTYEKALLAAQEIIESHLKNGFVESILSEKTEPIIFDNASWHYGGDFPCELDSHQAYIHTGFFIGWLLRKKLFTSEFQKDNIEGISKFLRKDITAPEFYKVYMDGKFMSYELNDQGIAFTIYYFDTDFSKSMYLDDLIAILCKNISSIYYIKDNWQNFEIIADLINQRYQDWSNNKKHKA
jgi:predicted DNA-binding WGR domain protein